MSRRVILRSTRSSNRKQPLLQSCQSYPQAGTRLGEAVGGTAAVCCCFSFGLANMVYLAVYKVPARLCQKALRKRRRSRSLMEEELVATRRRCLCGCCDDIMGGGRVYPLCCDDEDLAALRGRISVAKDEDVVELEKEMWERFYGSGFWRSASRRNNESFSSQERMLSSAMSSPNLQVLAVN
ncbi:uncharacterized protein LOC109813358 [Cajanus cajan]|uniref:Uncharacterized protein n=1 Tax=Cajanus cajan TaxID=3821 RepID=A0A151S3Y8_CAJCA|nr:uncharacterized protein LOC109813358 [Cajanus cajan]KYP49451.1 hypothetical protein KK1_028797 [Cajanus cajan]